GAVADRPDRAEAEAFAAAAAPFADAGEAQAARAVRVADRGAPLVAARAHRVVAERVVAAPRRGGGVRIAARAAVEHADHPELGRVAQRDLPRDVRVRVVARALDAVAVVVARRARRPHRALFAPRALFALGACARAALLR